MQPEYVELIQNASVEESDRSLVERLGVSINTVKRYRRMAREMRQEAARDHIAVEVGIAVPGALRDLAELRLRAMNDYRVTGDRDAGNIALNAIRITLQHVAPEPSSEWDGWTDAELERYAATGELPERAG